MPPERTDASDMLLLSQTTQGARFIGLPDTPLQASGAAGSFSATVIAWGHRQGTAPCRPHTSHVSKQEHSQRQRPPLGLWRNQREAAWVSGWSVRVIRRKQNLSMFREKGVISGAEYMRGLEFVSKLESFSHKRCNLLNMANIPC